jgi:small subunit ribosomal protein S5
MDNKDTIKKEEAVNTVKPAEGVSPVAKLASKIFPGKRMRDVAKRVSDSKSQSAGQRPGGRGQDGRRGERVKSEFDSKMIDIRRVTRVAAGGRRYTFSVAVVAGDRKGRVGVGLGKGLDTALAIDKATREAKKHMIRVPLTKSMTIPHAVEAKYGSARIMLFPARGRGVVAGSAARTVIELAGIRDICAKYMSGSKNKINNARVAIEALKGLITVPKSIMQNREKTDTKEVNTK